MTEWFGKESNRAWVYNVALAAGAVAVFYGLATQEEVALWIGLVMSLAGNGLARANTSTKG